MLYCIGVDVGGTQTKLVAVEPSGRILSSSTATTSGQNAGWAQQVRESVQAFQEKCGPRARRIGIAAPGLAASDNRSIANMPGRLAGIEGLDWTDFLGCERTVMVLNDAHAALVGEHWIGAARGFRDVILLTLGTGVGGAILLGGKLWQGRRGLAGHLGHICLDVDGLPDIVGVPGSLEDAIGECTLERRSGGRYRSTRELIAGYRASEAEAAAIWLKSVRALACAIASLIHALDPEAIVLGGGISQSADALFTPLKRCLDEVEWRPQGPCVEILPAQLGEFSGALGAARYAMTEGELR